MSTSTSTIQELANKEYQYGFVTDIESESIPRGLSEDVVSQTQESRSLRALSAAVRRLWLRRLLPQRAALLRAPYVEHIILEDWLLEHALK